MCVVGICKGRIPVSETTVEKVLTAIHADRSIELLVSFNDVPMDSQWTWSRRIPHSTFAFGWKVRRKIHRNRMSWRNHVRWMLKTRPVSTLIVFPGRGTAAIAEECRARGVEIIPSGTAKGASYAEDRGDSMYDAGSLAEQVQERGNPYGRLSRRDAEDD